MATFTMTVPDTAVAKLRAAFGGVTNAETLQNVREFLLPLLRAETMARLLAERQNTDSQVVVAGQAIEITSFDGAWPE